MKRKLCFAVTLLFFTWAFTSCMKQTCETCKLVTRTSTGDLVSSNVEAEYCGATLIAFKAANPDVTNPVTGNVTSLECN
jgi:hypothetical protein